MEIGMLVIAAALGAVLGLRFRFKVFVLLPAMAIAIAAAVIGAAKCGSGGWSIVGQMTMGVVSLQLGYLAGITGRRIRTSHRAPRTWTVMRGR